MLVFVKKAENSIKLLKFTRKKRLRSLVMEWQVISETLRLANIINAVWRKALKDVKIKGLFCVLYDF